MPADDTSHLDVVISFGDTPVNILSHQTWLHLDGAYLGRPKYFRITKNAFQPNDYIMDIDRPRTRWDALNTEICPWRIGGEIILICKVSERNEAFLGFNQQDDLERAIAAIKAKTNIPIVIREKVDKFTRPFEEDLERAQSLVTWASTTSVQAVLLGVPIFLLHDSARNPVANRTFRKEPSGLTISHINSGPGKKYVMVQPGHILWRRLDG
jgi:hypothetical protein